VAAGDCPFAIGQERGEVDWPGNAAENRARLPGREFVHASFPLPADDEPLAVAPKRDADRRGSDTRRRPQLGPRLFVPLANRAVLARRVAAVDTPYLTQVPAGRRPPGG